VPFCLLSCLLLADEVSRWRSENVSTNEVAEVLGLHPSVTDANVYGVSLPNHEGRAGCVAIVFNRGPDPAFLQDLANFVTAKLPKYAVPLFLRVTDEVQTNGNNKRQKHLLRGQGVEPAKVGDKDRLFWFNGGTYVPFKDADWERIVRGQAKL
jgi:acyl-CoA synthetase (AMP-forming)/AMP-acid ligase II